MLYFAVVDIYSQKISTLELYGSQVVLKHSIRTEVSCSQSDLLTSVLVIDNIINLRKFRILALSIIVPQGIDRRLTAIERQSRNESDIFVQVVL